MTDNQTPVDRALDLLVYAPLGFALDAKTLLPKLIDRGQDQMTNQVTMARMMGQFAVQQGQSEATKHLAVLQEQATSVLADLGLLPKPEPAPAATTEAPVAPAAPTTPAAKAPARRPAKKATASPRPAPPATEPGALAIPDYDSLAASQVIPRLEGLSAGEFESVRSYEATHRGRKTILNKIAQLQG